MRQSHDILNKTAIPLLAETDILIIGSGTAGSCAALAARAQGDLRVTLVERYGFAGGSSTQILDTFYGFFTPGSTPKKVVGGIPDRIVDRLDQAGRIFLRPNSYGAGTGITYDPEYLKYTWDRLLSEAGVHLLLHTQLVDVETDASGTLAAAIVWTKKGFFKIAAKRFIDASGDADLCHLADIPYEKAGDIDPAQTLTTTFRMSNVDWDRFRDSGGKEMLMARMERAMADGTHPLPRKAGSAHKMLQKGCIATVAVRVAEVDATDPEQLTAAEQEGRRQAYVFESFFRDCIPGYEASHIIGLSHQIGIRETRRVYGEYRLSKDDCLNARRFDDRILLCGAPIEDHRQNNKGEQETVWAYIPGGNAYDVPYRTLVPKGRDEIWVAGRCFSATHDAHASCRSMGQTLSMGQAAGLAASLSLETDAGARSIDIATLQMKLSDLGAVLEMPSNEANTEPDGWSRNPKP